jgi:hypothetical protein
MAASDDDGGGTSQPSCLHGDGFRRRRRRRRGLAVVSTWPWRRVAPTVAARASRRFSVRMGSSDGGGGRTSWDVCLAMMLGKGGGGGVGRRCSRGEGAKMMRTAAERAGRRLCVRMGSTGGDGAGSGDGDIPSRRERFVDGGNDGDAPWRWRRREPAVISTWLWRRATAMASVWAGRRIYMAMASGEADGSGASRPSYLHGVGRRRRRRRKPAVVSAWRRRRSAARPAGGDSQTTTAASAYRPAGLASGLGESFGVPSCPGLRPLLRLRRLWDLRPARMLEMRPRIAPLRHPLRGTARCECVSHMAG